MGDIVPTNVSGRGREPHREWARAGRFGGLRDYARRGTTSCERPLTASGKRPQYGYDLGATHG